MPFSFEGYTVIRNELITKRAPVGGNRRIPICLYCGIRHKLKKAARRRSELVNGTAVEYEEEWYYCEVTKLPFMTHQMSTRNHQRRAEAYEQSLRHVAGKQNDRTEE